MSESSIDLPYSYNRPSSNVNAPLIGELNSVPNSIFFNTRGSQYFEDADMFLIAESSSNNFECIKWLEVFRKGPLNTKYNNAQCKDEINNGNQVKRLYAFQSSDNKKGGLKPGAIAGIVIGVVAAVVIIVILVYFFVIKKNKNRNISDQENANSHDVDDM